MTAGKQQSVDLGGLPPRRDTSIACIGLGLMGGAMAANLLKAGYSVQGFDLDSQALARLTQLGGRAAAHPAAAASGASMALVMVNNATQVEHVLFGTDGIADALPPGAIVWVASTVPAADMQSFAERLQALGLDMVDGPVSGGLTGAEAGTLTIIAGGSPEAIEAIRGPMQACSERIHHVGKVGAGSTVKIVNNLLAASHVALTAEALALGMRAGADPEQLIRVITQSSGTSRMFEKRAPRIVAGDHAPHATVQTFLKDLEIALDTAQSLHCATPIASAARQVYRHSVDAGLAHASDTLLSRFYEASATVGSPASAQETPCKPSNKD